MTYFTAATALASATTATQRDFCPSGAVTSTSGIPVRTFDIFGICAVARPFFQLTKLTWASRRPAYQHPAIGSGSRSALTQPIGRARSLTALQWRMPAPLRIVVGPASGSRINPQRRHSG